MEANIDRSYKRLPREHDHIGSNFHIYAESQDHAADQQVSKFHHISLRIDPAQQQHGPVDKIPEYYRNWNLKETGFLKLSP